MGRGKPRADVTLAQHVQAYGVMAVPGQSGPRTDDAGSNPFTGQARQAAERARANNKSMEPRIAQSLEAAGVALKPAEWLLLRAAILVVGGLLGLLLFSASAVFGVLIVVAAIVGPWLYLRRKKKKRLK